MILPIIIGAVLMFGSLAYLCYEIYPQPLVSADYYTDPEDLCPVCPKCKGPMKVKSGAWYYDNPHEPDQIIECGCGFFQEVAT